MADPLARFLPTQTVLRRSVLDRLLDWEPARAADDLQPIGEQVAALREALRRDLEALMNTRCRPVTPPQGLEHSLLGYGIGSLHDEVLVTGEQREALARGLQHRIAMFEPRFATVLVELSPPRHPGERSLRMRIRATCAVDIDLPPVMFESELDPATQRFSVEEARG